MEPNWRQTASAMRSPKDLKNFLHKCVGLSLTEAREVADAVCSSSYSCAESAPLTKAGIARKARDFRELTERKHTLLYAAVRDDALAKARAYSGPMPATNLWIRLPGQKDEDLLTPYEQLCHAMAEEGAKALADELDACKDDDELESLLIARRWNVATIEHYLENFGKGQVHGTRSG